MEVTTAGLMLALVATLAVLALLAVLYVTLRARGPARPVSESLLLSCVLTPLILLAEMYSLSWFPGARPLRWLPLYHVILTVGFAWLVLRRWGPAPWQESFTSLARGIFSALRESGPLMAIALVGVPVLIGVYVRFGAYSTPETWDELECHVPLAVQPCQDGRVGTMTSDQLTVSTYPRGTPLLWAWTFLWTGTDLLFHPVQAAFGVVLLLAMWVLARRSNVPAWAASLGIIVLVTTPLFSVLATVGYIDIPHVAAVAAMLAFLAPPRDPACPSPRDWLPAALALALSCEIKYPFLPMVFAAVALAEAMLLRVSLREGIGSALRFIASRQGLAAFLIVAASCHLYISHWINHGNPFYIISLNIAGRTIFPGPCDNRALDSWGTTSVAKPVGEMTRIERYYRAWTDFDVPLSTDSFGSFGPVLPFALLAPAMICILTAVLERQTWRLALGVMLMFCIFMTPSQVPRYGLALFVLMVLCASGGMGLTTGRARFACAVVVLAFCWPGLRTGLDRIDNRLRAFRNQTGFSWKLRSSYLLEHHDMGAPWFASPQMVRQIRDRSGDGDELAWTVRTFPTMLLNRRWTNRIRHVAGSPHEIWPESAHLFPAVKPNELNAWLRRIEELAPRHVLVYERSEYARWLRANPLWGYRPVFADDSARGQYGMVLFERVDQPDTRPASRS